MPDQVRIESLNPQPWPDLRRVSLVVSVSGLPAHSQRLGSALIHPESLLTANVDWPPEADPHSEPDTGAHPVTGPGDDRETSPYPDMALSIIDPQGNEIAATFIVEHNEPELDFTLHLRASEPGATYIAHAEMIVNHKVTQIVQVPFELR